MLEKSRMKVVEYQTEVDMREQDIQKLTKLGEQKDDDIKMYELRLK